MLIPSAQTKRANRLLAILMGVSVLAHVAIIAAWALVIALPPPAKKLDDNIVKARLVKLGKQRDDKLLPRIDKKAPPPPAPQKATPPPPDTPAPPPKKKEPAPQPKEQQAPKPSSADILNSFRAREEKPDLDSLIEKTIGEPLDEGHEAGSRFGQELTGRMKAEYNDKLQAQIHAHYKLGKTLSDEERVRLKAVLAIKIGPNGQLLDAHIDEASGNDAFDSAVLAAAKRAAPFPPPPIPARDFYAQGVAFNFRP